MSALDDAFIVGSRNVGSAGAFVPVLDGERVAFEERDGAIIDVGTESTWNVLGQAVEGPLAGSQLEPVVSGSHFWFAWSVFKPETRVILTSVNASLAYGGCAPIMMAVTKGHEAWKSR